MWYVAFVELSRLSSQSVSSSETQNGVESQKEELLDTDTEHQTNIDTQEFSDSSAVIGFTE